MAEIVEPQAQPEAAHAQRIDPVVLPDVPTNATGVAESNPGASSPEAGEQMLQNVLPEISQVAQKVGGFKKLAEIASHLSDMGK